MVDPRRGQRLAHEALADLFGQPVAASVRDHGLQRDGASQLGVDGTVDGAHSALADVLADLVAIDPLSFDEFTITRHGIGLSTRKAHAKTSRRGRHDHPTGRFAAFRKSALVATLRATPIVRRWQ